MATKTNRGPSGVEPEQRRELPREGHEVRERDTNTARGAAEKAAQHNQRAAFHHETAAHHHGQAARHRANGRHDEASMHEDAAHEHGQRAREHGQRAYEHGQEQRREVHERSREEEGGLTSSSGDADDYVRSRGEGRASDDRDLDDEGRSMSDGGSRGYEGSSSTGGTRERDQEGRYNTATHARSERNGRADQS